MSPFILVFGLALSAHAQDAEPTLLSESMQGRQAAKDQLLDLIAKRKGEAFKILLDAPVVRGQSISSKHPIVTALEVLARLQASDSLDAIIKHIGTSSHIDGAFSEARLDYIGQHPAVAAVAAIGARAIPQCLDEIERLEGPDVACMLIALAEATGSKPAAKNAILERVAAVENKDVQARLKARLSAFDKLVSQELESAALKPIPEVTAWPQ